MKKKFNKLVEWILYIFGYFIAFLLTSLIFDSFYIDMNNYFFYSLLSVLLICLLNKTIKPILFYLTIPITGITLGLFYPIINLIILKITDWIMGPHFNLDNIIIAFFIAIIISIINLIIDELIIKPLTRRSKK